MSSDLENRAFLGYYANSGNFLPAFRNNLSVPFLGVTDLFLFLNYFTLGNRTDILSRNVGKIYHYSLHNNLEECSSHFSSTCGRSSVSFSKNPDLKIDNAIQRIASNDTLCNDQKVNLTFS